MFCSVQRYINWQWYFRTSFFLRISGFWTTVHQCRSFAFRLQEPDWRNELWLNWVTRERLSESRFLKILKIFFKKECFLQEKVPSFGVCYIVFRWRADGLSPAIMAEAQNSNNLVSNSKHSYLKKSHMLSRSEGTLFSNLFLVFFFISISSSARSARSLANSKTFKIGSHKSVFFLWWKFLLFEKKRVFSESILCFFRISFGGVAAV